MPQTTSELRVANLMTREVYTLEATQSLPLADAVMALRRVRHIPVVDEEGRVVGLVTHRDLLAAKISALAPLSEDERSSLQLPVPISKIMRTNVWTIGPDALASAAARIMREHRFGCLPVVAEGRLVGIVTEADMLAIVTELLARPLSPRASTLEHVMTPVPVTITPETTIADARATMARYGIRHLPVVENGKPVAMVGDRDLAVAEAIFTNASPPAAHVVRLLGHSAAHRMSPEAPLDGVLDEMFRERLDAVLVVDGDRLVGIFTALDVCRLLRGGSSTARLA